MIHRFPLLFLAFFGHANVRCDEWEGALAEQRIAHVPRGHGKAYAASVVDRMVMGVDYGKRDAARLFRIRHTEHGDMIEDVYG